MSLPIFFSIITFCFSKPLKIKIIFVPDSPKKFLVGQWKDLSIGELDGTEKRKIEKWRKKEEENIVLLKFLI